MQNFEENLASRVNGSLQPLLGVTVTVKTAQGLLATIYSDDGATVQPNPMVTDANGLFGFYAANGPYKLTFSGQQIQAYERDIELYDADDAPPLTQAEAALPSAASRVGFQADGLAAQGRTIENKLRETVSVKDFGAVGDGVTDDTARFQDAVNYCVANNRALYVNGGHSFLITSVNLSGLKRLYGDGDSSKVVHKPGIAPNTHMLVATGGVGYSVQSLYLDGSSVAASGESMLLRFNACSDVVVSDVTCNESSSSSIKFQGSSGNPCRNVIVTRCRSIKSGRAAGFNRNGLDFFLCHNLTVSECYVKGLGADPNNVGIIFMGCNSFSCDRNVLEDNASEQIQVIGTDYLTEQIPYNVNRAMYGSITGNILRHPSGFSKTSNMTIGENANDITVSGNDLSGSLGSAIVLFKWTKNVVITGNKIHDSRGSGVTINDKVYGNVTVQGNIIRDIDGASAIVVDSNTAPAPGILICDNQIINVDADGNATVSRPFEFKGAMLGGITVDRNICQGFYTHALDMTGGGLIGQFVISNNDFRGYTVAGWRAPLREAYCWGNIEPNMDAPSFYRASQAFTAATSGNVFKAWNAAQSKGVLSYKVVLDAASVGMAYVAEGIVTGSVTGEKKIRIIEVGAGAISGTLYLFSRPGSA
ncbi:right-handed parallel beta-helix repeat-containing protein [Oxalobacteraceae sp. CFBP 8755]|nr:right-handed parallel beta-helix repeat-containing protein [Oxalobacteraceae sp. CFBP 8755]